MCDWKECAVSLIFFWYIINENMAEEFCPCYMFHKLEGSSIMEIET
jgi:hypothetical protein